MATPTQTPTAASTRRRVSAQAMALAVETDPQFMAPERPSLLPGLVFVPLPDGLLVEGAAERQVLRGRAASTLLPAILPLLDGSRTRTQVAQTLPGTAPEAVQATLAMLYTCGLLEDAAGPAHPAGSEPTGAAAQSAAFLTRQIDTTRVNRNGAEIMARLGTARVLILGDPDGGDRVVAELHSCGVTRAAACPTLNLTGTRPDLVVLVSAGAPDVDAATRIDDACAAAGVPWLASTAHHTQCTIGPYLDRTHTACYRCAAAARPPVTGPRPGPRRLATWTALVAQEVVFLLGRVATPMSLRGSTEFTFEDWSQITTMVPRRPGCPYCDTARLPAPEPVTLAHAYEQSVGFPPRDLLNPKDHQHHYKAANLSLQREEKRYRSAVLRPLPAQESLPGVNGGYLETVMDPPVADGCLDVAALTVMLVRTVGLRPNPAIGMPAGDAPKIQRWSPTGGNLGSVQAYVLAASVAGLAAGAYHYQPVEHALATLRCPKQQHRDVNSLIVRAAGGQLRAQPAAVIVLTGAHARVSSKYADFAYRVLFLDAGAASAQLEAVAAGLRLRAVVANRWSDEVLLNELDLDPELEPITAVLGLYGVEQPMSQAITLARPGVAS